MEMIMFIGIQASGKSSLYRDRFVDTHQRLNLDILRTRHRERLLLDAFVAAKAPFVIDNTNVTAAERARYLAPARLAGFRCVGYWLQCSIDEALARNAARPLDSIVPDEAIRATRNRLEAPSIAEGFDELYVVRTRPSHAYEFEPWGEQRVAI